MTPVYEACVERGVQPVTPRHGTGSARQPKPLHCTHGLWTFAGADFKRKATEWRCPTGECVTRKSVWIEAENPLIPRESKRWRDLYAKRSAVEREFGRLKHDYGLSPLRVRGLERVRLHADLTMLGRLAQALCRAREAVPLAA